MPTVRSTGRDGAADGRRARPQTVPREHAGRWIGWSADGRRIVAVGDSFEACEQAADLAGFPPDQVAIERVPEARDRLTGSSL